MISGRGSRATKSGETRGFGSPININEKVEEAIGLPNQVKLEDLVAEST